MSDRLYVAGEWVDRAEGHWRERVDLAASDAATAYAAGLHDGYQLAIGELKGWAALLLEDLDSQAVAG